MIFCCTLARRPTLTPWPRVHSTIGLPIVDPQLPTVKLLSHEKLPSLSRALSVDEVGMSKASWLARLAVDGNANIGDVTDLTEEVVKILVRQLVRHVADVESWAWRVEPERADGGARAMILNHYAAPFEDGLVHDFDGPIRVLYILKLNEAKAVIA
jgi:hypothetical protein